MYGFHSYCEQPYTTLRPLEGPIGGWRPKRRRGCRRRILDIDDLSAKDLYHLGIFQEMPDIPVDEVDEELANEQKRALQAINFDILAAEIVDICAPIRVKEIQKEYTHRIAKLGLKKIKTAKLARYLAQLKAKKLRRMKQEEEALILMLL